MGKREESLIEAVEFNERSCDGPRCEYCHFRTHTRSLFSSKSLQNTKICNPCRGYEYRGGNLKEDARKCWRNRCKNPWDGKMRSLKAPKRKVGKQKTAKRITKKKRKPKTATSKPKPRKKPKPKQKPIQIAAENNTSEKYHFCEADLKFSGTLWKIQIVHKFLFKLSKSGAFKFIRLNSCNLWIRLSIPSSDQFLDFEIISFLWWVLSIR